MLSTILVYGALMFSLTAVCLALYAVRITKIRSVRAISLRRQMKMETELLEVTESLVTLRKALHTLRSRINMRNLRDSRKVDDDGEPDAKVDPDKWRAWARDKYLRK